MSTIKEVIQKVLREGIDLPPAITQYQQNKHFKSDFVGYIKDVENRNRKGFDERSQKWYPILDPNKQFKIIGYGHRILPNENFNGGVTEEAATQLLEDDLNIAASRVKNELIAQYKTDLYDHLPTESKEMLVDFMYNLGTLRSFPKFTRAVLTQDYTNLVKEYRRYMSGKELTGRNNEFYKRYLGSRIASNTFVPKTNTPAI